MIVHSYYTPYQENSTVPTILNSAADTKKLKQYINDGLKSFANHAPLPIALTEWNIFAEGSAQAVSYINGMHATLVLGELIKNSFGQGSRWDFMNGWNDGNCHGLFADGEPNTPKYTPRAPFFYMYYFQKFFGDKLVPSTVTGSSDVVSYASKFSSGQSGIVLVNKGTTEQIVSVKLNDFKVGERYYYYLLTGGADNGNFSRKVIVNGKTTTLDGGGPADYATLKPYSTIIAGEIKLSLPKWSTLYLLVENDTNLLKQSIQFDAIPSKTVDDADFNIAATASSGLPVQFASSNSGVATVQNGNVHIVGAGTCDIIAYQTGDTTYNAAVPVVQKLAVVKGNQTITFAELLPKTMGEPDFAPNATSSSGLPCTFKSSNTSVATIVNGKIQLKGSGSAIITAQQAGNVNYNVASDVTQELIVSAATGIKELPDDKVLELFPNPANDFITIKLNATNLNITIYNSFGALVYTHLASATELTIPVIEIGGNGIYFVKVNSTFRKFCVIR